MISHLKAIREFACHISLPSHATKLSTVIHEQTLMKISNNLDDFIPIVVERSLNMSVGPEWTTREMSKNDETTGHYQSWPRADKST